MPEAEKERQRKYEIDNAVYTLIKAIEIRKDKTLMSDVQKEMKRKQSDISEALRNIATKIVSEKGE